MPFRLLIYLTCLMCGPHHGFSQGNGWILHRAPEGRFKVEVPGQLVQKSVKASTDIGDLTTHLYILQTEEEAVETSGIYFYQISYCDFPPSVVHADSVELLQEFFRETVEAAVESVGGEVRYAEADRASGNPGYRWRIDYRDGEVAIRTRALVAGSRYYAWQVVCAAPYSLSADAGRFLESFQLLSE